MTSNRKKALFSIGILSLIFYGGYTLLFHATQNSRADELWWDASFTKRIKISFDTTTSATSTDLTNFPVAIQLNASRISYADTQNSGQDIRFVDADDATELNYEIETWNESGTSTIWVKVPQIDKNSNSDYIYMYYNNGAASDNATTTGVWDSSYSAVLHMKEDPSGPSPQMQDSTSKNNDGTSANMTSGNQMAGLLGGSLNFITASSTRVSIPYASTMELGTTGSVEALVKFDSFPSSSHVIVSYGALASGESYATGYLLSQSSDNLYAYWTSAAPDIQENDSLTADQWVFISLVNNAGSLTLYHDGVPIETKTGNGATSGSDHTWIGGSDNEWFMDGLIDEVRVSTAAHSSGWIAFEHCNMLQKTCASYAEAETYAGPGNLTRVFRGTGLSR